MYDTNILSKSNNNNNNNNIIIINNNNNNNRPAYSLPSAMGFPTRFE